jgi:hypothetical protein
MSIGARSPKFTLTDLARNDTLDSEQIRGTYFRKPKLPKLENVEGNERLFSEGELREALRSLWRIIPEGRWLNSHR